MMLQYKLLVAVLVLVAVTPDVFCRSKIAFGDKSGGYPFMVFLSIDLDYGKGQCGGSLIKPNWVLTAAHCAANAQDNKPYNPEQLTVYLDNTEAHDGYKVAVMRVIVHEHYDQPSYGDNDVAVLELPVDVPADQGATVQLAAALPDDKYAGQVALALGWGKTEYDEVSPVLLEAQITMIADNECVAYWDGDSPEGKVCSMAQDEQAGTGRGDSGGPVLVDEDGELVQIGLVSFGRSSVENATKYTAFTSTGYYHDWIEEHTAR